MRRIVSAITAAALAFSLVALATPADAAVAGFDSAWRGQSAYRDMTPGQSDTAVQAFFQNTGTTSWVKGSATQVDLAVCLDDKTTCNRSDPNEAAFNNGWLSATRYAAQSQTTIAPGQIGAFIYGITVPAGQAAGTYRFNGALVLSSNGEDIRNEGYFHQVVVTAAAAGTAATLTSLTPTTGSTAGGTSVTITGTGFACTPAFPTVTFGTANATVTSCGSTSVVASSPANPAGATNVTVTNTGAAASNALTFTYQDQVRPTFDSMTATGNRLTLTFSEGVCQTIGSAFTYGSGADILVTVNGVVVTPTGEDLPACSSATAATNTQTSFNFFLPSALVSGDNVSLTINTSGGDKIQDAVGNKVPAQTRTATATGDTTRPTISSAAGQNANVVRLTYSENVVCNNAEPGQFVFTRSSDNATTTATAVACTTANPGSTTVDLTLGAGNVLSGGTAGSITYTQSGTAANRIKDLSGNDATSPQTVTVTPFTADVGAPTLIDTRTTTTAGFGGTLDTGDVFKIVFSEAMETNSTGDILRVTDADGTVGEITCNSNPGAATAASGTSVGFNATCNWNTAGAETVGGTSRPQNTVMTVTILSVSAIGTTGAGTQAGMQIPATITDTSGIADTTGNAPNLSGSADRVIDLE